MSETVEVPPLTPRQEAAVKARQAFAAKFPTPEEQSAYFRELGARGTAHRVRLRPDEAAVLAQSAAIMNRMAGTVVLDGGA